MSCEICETKIPIVGLDICYDCVRDLQSEDASLRAENARLRQALDGLYVAIKERHYGRMPDEVQRAFDAAGAALAPEPTPDQPAAATPGEEAQP